MEQKEINNKENKEENTNKNYQIKNARIVKVWQSNYDKNRITIQLDKTFKSYNENGVFVEDADSFGIPNNRVLRECSSIEQLQLADAMAMGKPINPQIISLSLLNAIVTVDRTFKQKGEEREFEQGVYANDCFVSHIVSIKPDIKKLFADQLNKLIQTALIVKEEAVPNPWD